VRTRESRHPQGALIDGTQESSMNKKELSEADIRTKFITPAITGPGGSKWDVLTQIREEVYFTKGRVLVRGKTVQRGKAKKADYLLLYRTNLPLGVVEAKDNNHPVGGGMQQALEYAEILDSRSPTVPTATPSSNTTARPPVAP
jgi:type I restriction enzyme R subunit